MKKLFAIFLLLLSFNLLAADTSISWIAPVEREDNTSFTENEISEFKVYYGTVSGDYQNNVTVKRANIDTATPLNLTITLPTGFTYYFVVTTVDLDGRESTYSKEVSIPLDHENPKSPTGVIVIKIVTEVTVTNPTN